MEVRMGSRGVDVGRCSLSRVAIVMGAAGLAIGLGARDARGGDTERTWSNPLCIPSNLGSPGNWNPPGPIATTDVLIFAAGQGCATPVIDTYGAVAVARRIEVLGAPGQGMDVTLAGGAPLALVDPDGVGLLMRGGDSEPNATLRVSGAGNVLSTFWVQVGELLTQPGRLFVQDGAVVSTSRFELGLGSEAHVLSGGTIQSGFDSFDALIGGTMRVEAGGSWTASTGVATTTALSGISFAEVEILGDAFVSRALRVNSGAQVSVLGGGSLDVGRLQLGLTGLEFESSVVIDGAGSLLLSGRIPDEPGEFEAVGAPARVDVTAGGLWDARGPVAVEGTVSVDALSGWLVGGKLDVVSDGDLDLRGAFEAAGDVVLYSGTVSIDGPSAAATVQGWLDISRDGGTSRLTLPGDGATLSAGILQVNLNGTLEQLGASEINVVGGVSVGASSDDPSEAVLNIQSGRMTIGGGLGCDQAAFSASSLTVGAMAASGVSVLGDVFFSSSSRIDTSGLVLLRGGRSVEMNLDAEWLVGGGLSITEQSTLEIVDSTYQSPFNINVDGGSTLRIDGATVSTSGLNAGNFGGPLTNTLTVLNGGQLLTTEPLAASLLWFNTQMSVESGARWIASHPVLVQQFATLAPDGELRVNGYLQIQDTSTFSTAGSLLVGGQLPPGDGVSVSSELRLLNVFGSPSFNIAVGGPAGLTVAPGGVVRLQGYRGEQDLITASQGITLGGTLIIEASPGFDPASGASFELFSNAALQGRFSLHVLPGFADDRAYEVNYTTPGTLGPGGGAVELSVTTVGALLGLQPGPPAAVAGLPSSAAVGDLDGDGFDDLVVAVPDVNPSLPGKVVVLINNGVSGGIWQGFSSGTQITVGANPRAVALGNFDNDAVGPGESNLDIAVAHGTDDNIRIYTNDGTGVVFAEAAGSPIATGDNPSDLVAADFNSDGRSDLAVSSENDGTVLVLLNTGSVVKAAVSFSVGSEIVAGDMPVDIDVTDLDNDKDIDIVIANFGSSNLASSGNDGAGVFGSSSFASTGSGPVSVSTGDLSGNGLPDVVTANLNAGTVTVLGNSGGALTPIGDIPVGEEPRSVALVDLDGDGLRDITVVVNAPDGGRTIQLIRNLTTAGGVPTFAGITDLSTGNSPIFILTGDINADGRPDLISVDESPVAGLRAAPESGAAPTSDGSVTVFLNFTSPLPACAGDANGDLKVDGMDLSAVLAKFGQEMPPLTGPNLNGDSIVDGSDLSILLSAFGNVCGK